MTKKGTLEPTLTRNRYTSKRMVKDEYHWEKGIALQQSPGVRVWVHLAGTMMLCSPDLILRDLGCFCSYS